MKSKAIFNYKFYLDNPSLHGTDSLKITNHHFFGNFNSNREIDIYDIFEIDNEYYNVCSKSCDSNEVLIEPIDIDNDCDETYHEHDMVCPFCGYTDYDSWEYDEGTNEINCPHCNAELIMEKEVEVTYTTTLKSKPKINNIEREL
jgi:DNA-directed RNA polymerase subunit RPC12/RpoP